MDRRGRDTSNRSAAGQPQGQVPAPRPPQHGATRGHVQLQSSHGSSAHGAAQTQIKKRDVDMPMHFAQHSGDSPGKAAIPDKTSRPKPTSALGSSTQGKPDFLVPSASPLAKSSTRQRSQPPSKQKGDMNDYLLRPCRRCGRGISVREIKDHESGCKGLKICPESSHR